MVGMATVVLDVEEDWVVLEKLEEVLEKLEDGWEKLDEVLEKLEDGWEKLLGVEDEDSLLRSLM